MQTQEEIANLHSEVRELKKTIFVLRETLESETHKTSQAIQLVKSANQGEISILQHTVGAMRDQLDEVNANHRATIQTALVEASEEIRQLKETTSMLRQEME